MGGGSEGLLQGVNLPYIRDLKLTIRGARKKSSDPRDGDSTPSPQEERR
jgi:hypothetical protein